MNERLSALFQQVKSMLFRYPMVLLMSLAMAVTIIYAIEIEVSKETGYICLKLGIVFSLGISLLFALKMLSQRVGKELLWHGLGIVFLIGFYFILPEKEKDFNEVYAFVIVPSFILSHLLVAFTAFLKKENPEKNFWQYNKNLFVNFVLTIIFIHVLTGGIALAVLAVENLFNFDFDSKIYPEIFAFFSIFGSTVIFLLFNENGLDFLEKDGKYPVVLKFFTQFILIPLLLIYVVILYFYSVKILLNWELPRGWVSYLVLAYSLVGILALLLVHPLKDDTAKSWVKIFSKVFYFTLIPLIVLLLTAIFTRVLQYGYTEARYFVLLLALWLSAVVLCFIFNKKATIKFIPVSLFLFGLFALIFPYFNTFSVAKRSQKNELETILKQNNLLVNGKIDFNKPVVDSIADEVEDKFDFLSERFEKDYLGGFLNDSINAKFQKDNSNVWGLFKNRIYTQTTKNSDYVDLSLSSSNNSVFDIGDYEHLITLSNFFSTFPAKINQDTFMFEKRDDQFTIKLNDKETVDLMPMIKKLLDNYKDSKEINIRVDDLSVESDLGDYHIKVFFGHINYYNYNHSKQANYHFSDMVILVKKNN